jgi:eukaryotic-like serine/threonine-protein kinase
VLSQGHPPHQPSPSASDAGTVLGGRYRLETLIGRGAMGEVWKAQHLMLGTPLAVKLVDLAASSRPEILSRFEQEARAAAFIDSPHAVRILDYGNEGSLAYIAMELLRGENLSSRLARLGRIEPRRVSALVVEMSRALSKAHAMGIVHRDIKPQNVMLAEVDGWEVAKLLDFGIAKIMTESMWAGDITANGRIIETHAGLIVGTPAYMSPEQTLGNGPLDGRSDLWQVAVVAFEAICGRRPFIGDNLGQLFVQICNAPIPRPSDVSDVPAGFDAWFERATQRDPAARFQSADAMADALAAIIPPATAPAARAPAASLDPTAGVAPLAAAHTTTRGLSHDALASSQWRFQLGLIGGLVVGVVVAGSVTAWWLAGRTGPSAAAETSASSSPAGAPGPPEAASLESERSPDRAPPTSKAPDKSVGTATPETSSSTAPGVATPSTAPSASSAPAAKAPVPGWKGSASPRPEDILGL